MTARRLEGAIGIVVLLLAAGATAAVIVRGTDTARAHRAAAAQLTGGDAMRGAAAIGQVGCGACHKIPGITGANGRVGPDLSAVEQNVFVAGVEANRAENLVQWIMNPREVDSKTAMPDLGLDRQTAQDIAAYLYAESTN
jgi:cytochrome c2